MKEFAQQFKWQLMILHKNNLINISVGVTIIYAFIFYAIRHLGELDKLLTLLIFNDPAVIGLLFIGLGFLMEKNQRVLSVFLVSPHNPHVYLLSRILSLSLVGMLCALGMAFFAKGLAFNILEFTLGAIGTCFIFSCLGFIIVSRSSEFLVYLLKSVPVLFLMALPLFNYFGITEIWIFQLLPTQGCVNLMADSYHTSELDVSVLLSVLSTIFWSIALYFISFIMFQKRIRHEPVD